MLHTGESSIHKRKKMNFVICIQELQTKYVLIGDVKTGLNDLNAIVGKYERIMKFLKRSLNKVK